MDKGEGHRGPSTGRLIRGACGTPRSRPNMGAAFQELWSRQELRPNCNISIRELWGVHELLPKLFSREFKFGRSPDSQNSDRIQEIQGGSAEVVSEGH